MKIQRLLLSQLQDALIPGKVLVLYGPRQVGKTTLAKDLLSSVSLSSRFVNADELVYREALASQNRQRLGEVLGDAELGKTICSSSAAKQTRQLGAWSMHTFGAPTIKKRLTASKSTAANCTVMNSNGRAEKSAGQPAANSSTRILDRS